ncbi:MAG TPA: hypothetical protein VFZ08_12520 [Terriglobia bacterium]|nr:hypothetical protein [Terriglobia bacterium]
MIANFFAGIKPKPILEIIRGRILLMDVEKTIQFILDMQAKHEAVIQQADERFANFREQTEERFRGLVDVSMSLASHLQTLTHSVEETNTSVRELREAQASTDYKLNALIETVDKLVKRNGHPLA